MVVVPSKPGKYCRFPTDSFREMHGTTKGSAAAALMREYLRSATFCVLRKAISPAAFVAVPQNTLERGGSARTLPRKGKERKG
jgi:hypothetical protein